MNDVCVSSRSDAVAAAAVAAAAAGAATDCVSASYGRPCSSRRICHVTDEHTLLLSLYV